MREFINLVFVFLYFINDISGKYMEGELHTSENWAFLARFCFLSEEGQFEYYFEYNDEQGEPNLLLYYDADDQWPVVYKTNKTCKEKESVLHTDQNQIVNLTARFPYYRELSGCIATPPLPTTAIPHHTIMIPTIKKNPWKRPNSTSSTTNFTITVTTKEWNDINKSDTTTSVDFEEVTSLNSSDEDSVTSPMTSSLDDFSTSSLVYSSSNGFTENVDYSTMMKDLENIYDNAETTNVAIAGTSKGIIKKREITPRPITTPKLTKSKTIICRNARRFRSARERWWFLAISNCNGSKGIHIKYKILMTNGPQGDYWHEHFSADEFYILPVLMAFCIAYCFLLLAIVICSIELKSRQLLHSTYKLFVLSVLLQFFGIMCQSMAYLKYAVNGVGAPKVKILEFLIKFLEGNVLGAVFMGASETNFLLLLLLLAKGYTITRGRLPLAASVKLTIFMCLYVVTYTSLFIYEAKVFDPGEVLYLYESPAGYGLIILRIAAWCMFIYSTVFTLKHYPEKSNFYYPFNICGTLWFIAGPAFILSANSYIDKWVRESVVVAVLLFITFGGHLMFLVLTMPSVANKNFPYHVRTTQIGVMELTGSNGIEQFNHHVYEPNEGIEQTVIIPLTRRTEEIFGGLYNQRLNHRSSQVNEEEEIEHIPNGQDVIMQNVLSWSIAKNFTPIDLGVFHQVDRSCLGSAHSQSSNNSVCNQLEENNHVPSSANRERKPSLTETPTHTTEEWVKEVPVELFTISKMVAISKPNSGQEHAT